MVASYAGKDPAKYSTSCHCFGACAVEMSGIEYALAGRKSLLRDLSPMIDHLLVSGPSELAEIHRTFPA